MWDAWNGSVRSIIVVWFGWFYCESSHQDILFVGVASKF